MTKFNFLILHSSGQIPGRLSSYSRAFLLILYCALPFTLANCSSDKAPIEPVKRTVETAPVKHPLKTPLPKGMVEAFFNDLDTGGDQMSQSPKEAGLVVVVRIGDTEYRQTIAICNDLSIGSVLVASVLEEARCNGEYRLVTEPGSLQVVRIDTKPKQQIARFELPEGVTVEVPHIPRSIDTAPVKHPRKTPLPPGLVEAFFEMDTGGDQMSRAKEAGMVLVVRMGDADYRQTIASCKDPALGSALGGGSERILEVAMCYGEFWLVTEPGSLQVIRMDTKPEQSITKFKLPDNVRAVTPANKYY